jgi:dCTP deaminase
MILTGPQIDKEVKRGEITIHPFHIEQLNPNSYNYRLGPVLYEVETPTDVRAASVMGRNIPLPETGYVLQPGRLYLGSTVEQIGSRGFIPSLIGRSTLGRLGVWLQVTADLGNVGQLGHSWTLELRVVQPVRLYPKMIVGQVMFWSGHGAPELYAGDYDVFNRPQPSLLHTEERGSSRKTAAEEEKQ